MAPHVVHQVAFRVETFTTAEGAQEGSVVGVNPLVHLKILFLTEQFPTARVVAFEGLRSIVHMHVSLEAALAAADSTTPIKWARVHLLLSSFFLDQSTGSSRQA